MGTGEATRQWGTLAALAGAPHGSSQLPVTPVRPLLTSKSTRDVRGAHTDKQACTPGTKIKKKNQSGHGSVQF